MKYSVVIATYNRAAELRDTLNSLAALQPDGPWEVVVVDNNSSDDTATVHHGGRKGFPVPLRYVHEAVQGRSAALNTGIRHASGEIIVTTDDDVRVEPDWLDRAGRGSRAPLVRLRGWTRPADLARCHGPDWLAGPAGTALGGACASR